MKYKYLFYKSKRPNSSKEEFKQELIQYIKEETQTGHFPSRRELERNFHFKLDDLFEGIKELYNSAGIRYKQEVSQELKYKKATILLTLVLKNLEKFGLSLVTFRKANERGIDIVAKQKNSRIGIELKAYNSQEKLKIRDICQVKRFIKKENLKRAIIITTTMLQDTKISYDDKICIIFYEQLAAILGKESKKQLDYIKTYSINRTTKHKQIKKQQILDYVKLEYHIYNRKPRYNEILKELHLDLYTYFNSLFEIYKILKIPIWTKNMNGPRASNPDPEILEIWKNEFKIYINNIIKKEKRFPSGVEIGEHFGISHIWNVVKVNTLYKELGLPTYQERAQRKLLPL